MNKALEIAKAFITEIANNKETYYCDAEDTLKEIEAAEKSGAALSQEKPDEYISNIYKICDAYESGIGNGLQKDTHNKGYYDSDWLNEPYEIGYKKGLELWRPQPQGEQE